MHPEVEMVNDDVVVAPEAVLQGALSLFTDKAPDQILIVAMKDGQFEIFSSHSADEAENMLDDAFDALYDGELGFAE